jgi:hypothetical protein
VLFDHPDADLPPDYAYADCLLAPASHGGLGCPGLRNLVVD